MGPSFGTSAARLGNRLVLTAFDLVLNPGADGPSLTRPAVIDESLSRQTLLPDSDILGGAGTKRFHHSVVGDLDLAYESVDVVSEPGLTLTLYAAEPASSTAHALDLLASWTTTQSDSSAPVTTRAAPHPTRDEGE